MTRPPQISLPNFASILLPFCAPPQSWTYLKSGAVPRGIPSWAFFSGFCGVLIQLHFPGSMMSGASLPARVPFATLQSGLPFNAAAANSRIDIATPFETLGRAYGFAAGVCVRCMWDAHCGHAQRACFVLCVYVCV